MNLLDIQLNTWGDRWALAGISVATVFVILVVLVLALYIFNFLARKTEKPVAPAPEGPVQPQILPLSEASQEDKVAVAMAIHLYQSDTRNTKRVLTIKHNDSTAWHGVLNTRL